MSRFVEVSHRVVAGMKTYPGLPEPELEVLLDYEASREKYGGLAEFFIAKLHLCGNTGTYVDAPVHRHRGAADLASLPLDRLADLPFLVVDAPERAIRVELVRDLDVKGRAVLFRTGFSKSWGTPRYFGKNPFVTGAACDALVEGGAAFVGIDSLNVDDIDDLARPAHTKLLGAGIPVCEHMTNLEGLADLERRDAARLHAVPVAWAGGATFPVRAYVVDP